MSGKSLKVETIFTAVDGMSPSFRTMGRGLEGFAGRMDAIAARSDRMFRRMTPAISEAQKQLLSMVGTAAAVSSAFALGRFSINSLLEYEKALHSLQAVTGVSNAQMIGFKSEIASLAGQSKKSSIEIAKSFETVGSMMSQYLSDPRGLRQITEAGITLSRAAGMELEPTLQSLTSVMNQFGLQADQAVDTINRLTAGEIVGSIRTGEVASMLQEFGAVAKTMNVSVGESTALIEALGKQMDKSKIGVGARNLLTIMGAAGGLDKKAVRDLHSAGVNTKFLMDNTQSLSARLHELSKIAHDPIKMVSVFGKENLTAAQVIFQQLSTYDQWAAQIQTTNEAHRQAAQNSDTLSEALKRLGDQWVNMLTTSDKSNEGMERAKSITNALTENLDTIVDTTISVVKWFAIWKAGTIALTAVANGANIVLGVRNALQLRSIALLEGNIVATKASIITEKLMVAQIWLTNAANSTLSATTALATGNMVAFNAAIAANPIGVLVLGVGALAAAMGYLIFQHYKLRQEYEQDLHRRTVESMSQEVKTVEQLAQKYIKLGMSKEEAMRKAIAFEKNEIAMQQVTNRAEIASLREQLNAKRQFIPGIGMLDLPGAGAIRDKLLAKQQVGTDLASQSLGLTNLLISKTAPDMAARERTDLSGVQFSQAEALQLFKNLPVQSAIGANARATAAGEVSTNNAHATITIKNDSENTAELNSKGKSLNITPKMTSTMTVK